MFLLGASVVRAGVIYVDQEPRRMAPPEPLVLLTPDGALPAAVTWSGDRKSISVVAFDGAGWQFDATSGLRLSAKDALTKLHSVGASSNAGAVIEWHEDVGDGKSLNPTPATLVTRNGDRVALGRWKWVSEAWWTHDASVVILGTENGLVAFDARTGAKRGEVIAKDPYYGPGSLSIADTGEAAAFTDGNKLSFWTFGNDTTACVVPPRTNAISLSVDGTKAIIASRLTDENSADVSLQTVSRIDCSLSSVATIPCATWVMPLWRGELPSAWYETGWRDRDGDQQPDADCHASEAPQLGSWGPKSPGTVGWGWAVDAFPGGPRVWADPTSDSVAAWGSDRLLRVFRPGVATSDDAAYPRTEATVVHGVPGDGVDGTPTKVPVPVAAISSDVSSTHLVVGYGDGCLSGWNRADGSPDWQHCPEEGSIVATGYLAKDNLYWSAASSGVVRLWDPMTGADRGRWENPAKVGGQRAAIEAAETVHHGQAIAVESFQIVYYLSLGEGGAITSSSAHATDTFRCCELGKAWTFDGAIDAFAASDERPRDQETRTVPGASPAIALRVPKPGTGWSEGLIRLGSSATGLKREVATAGAPITSLCFGGGGAKVVSADASGRVRAWDVSSGATIWSWDRFFDPLFSEPYGNFAPSRQDVRVRCLGGTVLASYSRAVVGLDETTGAAEWGFDILDGGVSTTAGLADGTVAVGSEDGEIALWDPNASRIELKAALGQDGRWRTWTNDLGKRTGVLGGGGN